MTPEPTHAAFARAAAADGIELERRSFDWLCEQGHVGLERVAKARRDPAIVAPVQSALEVLQAIYARLKGDVTVLHAARANLLLPVDLVHAATGTVIEVDGPEHFTSYRRSTLDLYPAGVPLGFELEDVPRALRSARADQRRHRARPAGEGVRVRRRAARAGVPRCAARPRRSPAMGHPPVLRIAAEDGDGAAAYARHRERLLPAQRGLIRFASRTAPGSTDSSGIATLMVLQTAHFTRTFGVM